MRQNGAKSLDKFLLEHHVVRGRDLVEEISLHLNNFIVGMTELKESYGFNFFIDCCCLKIDESNYNVIYHLRNLELHTLVRVIVKVGPGDIIPTVRLLWSGSIRPEKECHEIYGLNFSEVRNSSVRGGQFNKKNGSYRDVVLPVFETGPYYSSLGSGPKISVAHFGGRIKDVTVETGFFHKGIEKIIEGQNLCQVGSFIERLNSNSSVMLEVAWFKALEQLFDVDITDRSKVLRTIFMELSRVSGHLHVLANVSQASGSNHLFEFVYGLRDIVLTLFEDICGRKMNMSLIRFGGVAYDLPKYWMAKCWDVIGHIEKELLSLDKNVIKNSIWIDKLSVGKMDYRDLLDNGVSGPALRAVGINYDLRKRKPYYFYKDLDFEVPLGNLGSCYDLYIIRVEEIRQSCKIIAQLLDNIPVGSVTDNTKIRINKSDLPKERVSVYSEIESVNGEFGIFTVVDRDVKPCRVKCVTPSLGLAHGLEKILLEQELEDIPIILFSLGISANELDR